MFKCNAYTIMCIFYLFSLLHLNGAVLELTLDGRFWCLFVTYEHILLGSKKIIINTWKDSKTTKQKIKVFLMQSSLRIYDSSWILRAKQTNLIYHNKTVITCCGGCNSCRQSHISIQSGSVSCEELHYYLSAQWEKTSSFFDPTDFISDNATSNLSYSSQKNTFCHSQKKQ